jgi:hypothetical protein
MQEAETERIAVPGQPQQNFTRPLSGKMLGMMRNIKQEDHSLLQPGQKARLYLQNNQSKQGSSRIESA